MNRQAIIAALQRFLTDEDLFLDQVTVNSGAAMVLHGLREKTKDLDIEVPTDVFTRLREKYTPGIIPLRFHEDLPMSHEWQLKPYIAYGDEIEIFIERETSVEMLDEDILVYTPRALLEQKQLLNRPKDQRDIRRLMQHLNE